MKTALILICALFCLSSCVKKSDSDEVSLVLKKNLGVSYGSVNNYLSLTQDNQLLLLRYENDRSVLYKTDASGNTLWKKNLTDTSKIKGFKIKQIKDGNFIVVGNKQVSSLDWTAYKTCIIKVKDNGDILWEHSFYPNHYNTAYDLQELDNGDLLLLCGHEIMTNSIIEQAYLMKLNAQGDSITSKLFNFGLKAFDLNRKDNNFNILADRLLQEDGGALYNGNIVFYSVDANMNKVSAKTVSSDYRVEPEGHLVANTGEVYVYGKLETSSMVTDDIFLSKLNTEGDTVWCKTKNYLEKDCIIDMIQTADGGFAATGTSKDLSYIIREYVFFMRLDAHGNIVLKKDFDIGEEPIAYSIVEIAPNKFRILGYSSVEGKLLIMGIE